MLPVSRGDHQGQDDQRDDPDPLRRRQLGEGEEESGDTGQGRGHQKDSGPPVDPHSCDEPTYHDQSSGNGYDTDDGMNQGKRDDVHGVLLEWNVLQEIHGRRSPGWPGRSAPRKRRRWSYVVSGLIVLLVSLERTPPSWPSTQLGGLGLCGTATTAAQRARTRGFATPAFAGCASIGRLGGLR